MPPRLKDLFPLGLLAITSCLPCFPELGLATSLVLPFHFTFSTSSSFHVFSKSGFSGP